AAPHRGALSNLRTRRLYCSIARSPAREDRGRDRGGAARGTAAAGLDAQRPHARGYRVMTAPLRSSDPIVVDVALGDRSYDIVIGRGQLATLGARVAKLRPGAKVAIVSDENVAAKHLEAAVAAANGGAAQVSTVVLPPGESTKSFEHLA